MARDDASARAGIDVQLAVCEQAARQRRLEVTERAVDLGATGASLLRPGIQRLMAAVHERRIEAVVVTGVAQLTSRRDDWQFLEALLRESHVQLFTVVAAEGGAMSPRDQQPAAPARQN